MSDEGEIEPVSKAELGQAGEELEYLNLISTGVPPMHAAYQVGWTPAKLRRLMRDRTFATAVSEAEQMRDESIEEALFNMAHGLRVKSEDDETYVVAPDFRAVQWWLSHRRPEQWWDSKGGPQNTTITVSVEVKDLARETILATLTGDPDAIRALQPGGIIDVEEVEDVDGDS